MARSILDDDQQYRLVFPGNILPGTDFDEVVFDLARLLKTSSDSAKKLVSGKKMHVKLTFTYEKADRLRAQVLQLGVECELEPVDDSISTSKPGKSKRKKPFPEPENFAMQSAKSDQTSNQEKSYSETMAEFQKHASAHRMEKTGKVELDELAISLNTERGQDKNQDEKSASLKIIRRRQALFVGENIDDYLAKFEKFQQGGIPHFVFTWHWPAFFVPFFWAIYRKLWGWSIIMFISLIFLPLLSNILWGTVANYIYYRHSMLKIKTIRKRHSSDKIDEKLSESGGTSKLALSAALLVTLLLMNGVYWTSKLSPVFSTLNENLDKIEQSKP
ncbi:MAG: hypothetical protein BMS9Abin25_0998 [Gammaproteobacteria bacterium]|nr:MAG: hypothetical protein BMS9Abin25_0998 [Gammaproteobacteria bacterium]